VMATSTSRSRTAAVEFAPSADWNLKFSHLPGP
jgi:hypothetical protein